MKAETSASPEWPEGILGELKRFVGLVTLARSAYNTP